MSATSLLRNSAVMFWFVLVCPFSPLRRRRARPAEEEPFFGMYGVRLSPKPASVMPFSLSQVFTFSDVCSRVRSILEREKLVH